MKFSPEDAVMSVLSLFSLENKVALITGGSRGLGLQMAHALGEAGAKLALVARNANFEKTVVTGAAPAWDGDMASNPAAVLANNINLSQSSFDTSGNPTWQNYRYRVLQTTVPLRNLVWQGAQTGC